MLWLDAHVDYDGDDCLIWPFQRDKDGYARVASGSACRVMCEKVSGPPTSPTMVAAHSCGKGHTGCVHPKHLEWKTQRANIEDKKLHGTDQSGERHNLAKLTWPQVDEIRQLRGKLPRPEVAKMFSISVSNVGMIQRGQTWRADAG